MRFLFESVHCDGGRDGLTKADIEIRPLAGSGLFKATSVELPGSGCVAATEECARQGMERMVEREKEKREGAVT